MSVLSSELPTCVSGIQHLCPVLNLRDLHEHVFTVIKIPHGALVSRYNHRGKVLGHVCKDNEDASKVHFVQKCALHSLGLGEVEYETEYIVINH